MGVSFAIVFSEVVIDGIAGLVLARVVRSALQKASGRGLFCSIVGTIVCATIVVLCAFGRVWVYVSVCVDAWCHIISFTFALGYCTQGSMLCYSFLPLYNAHKVICKGETSVTPLGIVPHEVS